MNAQTPNIWVKILLAKQWVNYRTHGDHGRMSIWGQMQAYGKPQPSFFVGLS